MIVLELKFDLKERFFKVIKFYFFDFYLVLVRFRLEEMIGLRLFGGLGVEFGVLGFWLVSVFVILVMENSCYYYIYFLYELVF